RIHLQNLDIRARTIHPKPDPPDAGTEHLIWRFIYVEPEANSTPEACCSGRVPSGANYESDASFSTSETAFW
ncbi:MAG: hypothetical protein Q7J57_13365, partial [Gemmobacter sp.]|nr:hypothetical protein [Gemmobacter sp.]